AGIVRRSRRRVVRRGPRGDRRGTIRARGGSLQSAHRAEVEPYRRRAVLEGIRAEQDRAAHRSVDDAVGAREGVSREPVDEGCESARDRHPPVVGPDCLARRAERRRAEDVRAQRADAERLGARAAGDRARLLSLAKTEKDAALRGDAVRQLGVMHGDTELAELYQTETAAEVKKSILQAMFLAGSDKLIDLARNEKDPELRRAAIHN